MWSEIAFGGKVFHVAAGDSSIYLNSAVWMDIPSWLEIVWKFSWSLTLIHLARKAYIYI